MGLPGRKLHALRFQAVSSLFRRKKTASTGLRLLSSALGAQIDPARLYHGEVVYMWARAVWEGPPPLNILQACFEAARGHLQAAASK